MARLVDDLLTLARVDSGQVPLNLQQIDVSALISSTGTDLQALGVATGGHVTVQGEPSIQARVDGDRLRQVLVILVDNALRHGGSGGTVEVRVAQVGTNVHLEVADHGPGIPVSQRSHVFERFHQLDGSRSAAGTGLGLSIAHWIVRSHRGSIRLLDNNPGLRVQVSLPAADPAIRRSGGPVDHSAEPQSANRPPKRASTN
jgi:signal transduction histidine kinase